MVRALISSCNRLPAAFCNRISASLPETRSIQNRIAPAWAADVGKLGGEVAVTVFSHEAPEAAAARPHSSEMIRVAVPGWRLTKNSGERGRVRFNNASVMSDNKRRHEKTRGNAACFLIESKRPLRLLRAGRGSGSCRRRGCRAGGRFFGRGGRRLFVQGSVTSVVKSICPWSAG